MITHLSVVTILVRDEDEALRFYTEKLGFEKKDDAEFGPGHRWLTVTTREQPELQIFLARGDAFGMNLMDQVGKGPSWAFGTNDCRQTYEELSARGVTFTTEPQDKFYGVEATFEDPFGNKFALVEEKEHADAV